MRIKELKAAVLGELHKLYEQQGTTPRLIVSSLYKDFPDAKPGSIESVMDEFRDNGIATFVNGGARLTTRGIEQIEDPTTEAAALIQQSVTIHGGNVQIGNGNSQNITYSTVIHSLIDRIEENPDVPEAKKTEWAETLRKIAAHPLTQTAIQVAGAGGVARFLTP